MTRACVRVCVRVRPWGWVIAWQLNSGTIWIWFQTSSGDESLSICLLLCHLFQPLPISSFTSPDRLSCLLSPLCANLKNPPLQLVAFLPQWFWAVPSSISGSQRLQRSWRAGFTSQQAAPAKPRWAPRVQADICQRYSDLTREQETEERVRVLPGGESSASLWPHPACPAWPLASSPGSYWCGAGTAVAASLRGSAGPPISAWGKPGCRPAPWWVFASSRAGDWLLQTPGLWSAWLPWCWLDTTWNKTASALMGWWFTLIVQRSHLWNDLSQFGLWVVVMEAAVSPGKVNYSKSKLLQDTRKVKQTSAAGDSEAPVGNRSEVAACTMAEYRGHSNQDARSPRHAGARRSLLSQTQLHLSSKIFTSAAAPSCLPAPR